MESFLQELAQPRPDPGGGAAAAYGAGLGLALLEKVALLEGRRRPAPGAAPSAWDQALARLRGLSEDFAKLQEADVRAYFNFTAARASGDPGRLAAAVREAVDCPRQIMVKAAEALELLSWAGAHCRRHLVSDLLVAVEFLGAALRGAGHIASANLPLLAEAAGRRALAAELEQSRREGEDLYQRAKAGMKDRIHT